MADVAPYNTHALARALGLFQLSKCRSVYLLSINQLDLFYSDMKLRKSVCKTLAIFLHIVMLLIHVTLNSYVKTVAFLR